MITKYIVFGQTHKHPDTGQALKNYMIKVQAFDEALINVYVARKFGPYYSRIIDNQDTTHFPGGVLETHILADFVFKGETSHELITIDKKAVTINEPEPTQTEGDKDDKGRSRTKTGGVPGEEQKTGSNKPEASGEAEPKSESKSSLDCLSGGADNDAGEKDDGVKGEA